MARTLLKLKFHLFSILATGLIAGFFLISVPHTAWADENLNSCKFILHDSIPPLAKRFELKAYPRIQLAPDISLPARSVRHIFHGDLLEQPSSVTGRILQHLDGGMHTRAALIDFLTYRPDLRAYLEAESGSIQTFNNGVAIIYLPEKAFSERVLKTDFASRRNGGGGIVKSIFPRTWTNAKILDAIAYVAINGDVLSEKPLSQTRVGTVDGVGIRVFLERSANGWEIFTAYPLRPKITRK